jgi:hypothetical protein
MKKLLLTFFAVMLLSPLTAFGKKNGETNQANNDAEIWHVQWISVNSGPYSAMWAKRNNQGQYYGHWSTGARGNLVIRKTPTSFEGSVVTTASCNFSGFIKENNFIEGRYSCIGGDTGRVAGNITYGFYKN